MVQPSPSPQASSVKQQLQASASQFWSSMKTFEESIKKPMVTPEHATNDQEEGPHVSLESVIRVMFGSCTTGIVTPNSDSNSTGQGQNHMGSPNSSREKSRSTCEPMSPTRNEDSLYMKLFSDNQLRAEEAVHHLRQVVEDRKAARSPSRRIPDHTGKKVPGLFPVSSPNHKREIAIPHLSSEAPPSAVPDGKMKGDLSFDDGVSCISQWTLEELAILHKGDTGSLPRVHSDITQDPVDLTDESWRHTVNPNRENSPNQKHGMSPLRFTRQGRSQGTLNTKQSRGTMGTKSTMSTQTHEFASKFQKDEQLYWQDMVKEDEHEPSVEDSRPSRQERLIRAREITRRSRSRSKSQDKKSKRDGTIATVNSSLYSGRSSSHMSSAAQNDPDRLMEVLVMPPNTEMGEI